jgi:hypothetical protein
MEIRGKHHKQSFYSKHHPTAKRTGYSGRIEGAQSTYEKSPEQWHDVGQGSLVEYLSGKSAKRPAAVRSLIGKGFGIREPTKADQVLGRTKSSFETYSKAREMQADYTFGTEKALWKKHPKTALRHDIESGYGEVDLNEGGGVTYHSFASNSVSWLSSDDFKNKLDNVIFDDKLVEEFNLTAEEIDETGEAMFGEFLKSGKSPPEAGKAVTEWKNKMFAQLEKGGEVSIDSTMITNIEYSTKNMVMRVTFKLGDVVIYDRVPANVYAELKFINQRGGSVGARFWEIVRQYHPGFYTREGSKFPYKTAVRSERETADEKEERLDMQYPDRLPEETAEEREERKAYVKTYRQEKKKWDEDQKKAEKQFEREYENYIRKEAKTYSTISLRRGYDNPNYLDYLERKAAREEKIFGFRREEGWDEE